MRSIYEYKQLKLKNYENKNFKCIINLIRLNVN